MTTTNTRGEYPPIAILERTRKALSKSASGLDRDDYGEAYMLHDLADAYLVVWKIERKIADDNDVKVDFTLPNWVLDAADLSEIIEIRS